MKQWKTYEFPLLLSGARTPDSCVQDSRAIHSATKVYKIWKYFSFLSQSVTRLCSSLWERARWGVANSYLILRLMSKSSDLASNMSTRANSSQIQLNRWKVLWNNEKRTNFHTFSVTHLPVDFGTPPRGGFNSAPVTRHLVQFGALKKISKLGA